MKKEQIWSAFHQEIQLFYYNGEHIYDTPNRERDYARIGEPPMKSPLWTFIDQMMAFHMPERGCYGPYDEQAMRKAIQDILKVVEKPMLKTAEKERSYATIAVLEKVREWLKEEGK